MRKRVFFDDAFNWSPAAGDIHHHTTVGTAKADAVAYANKVTIPANTLKPGDVVTVSWSHVLGTVTPVGAANMFSGFKLQGSIQTFVDYHTGVSTGKVYAVAASFVVVSVSAGSCVLRYLFIANGQDATYRDTIDFTSDVDVTAVQCWETGTVASVSDAVGGVAVEVWRDVSDWDSVRVVYTAHDASGHPTAGLRLEYATAEDLAADVSPWPLARAKRALVFTYSSGKIVAMTAADA